MNAVSWLKQIRPLAEVLFGSELEMTFIDGQLYNFYGATQKELQDLTIIKKAAFMNSVRRLNSLVVRNRGHRAQSCCLLKTEANCNF